MSDSSSSEDTETYSPREYPKTRQSYTCEVCGKKLSRAAHLQRHRLLHSKSNVELFQCQLCDKSFTRKDVYQRHKRGVHGSPNTSRSNGRKKSCRRCIKYKLRCTRESPCAACHNKDMQCIYDMRGTDTQGLPLNSTETDQLAKEHNNECPGPTTSDNPVPIIAHSSSVAHGGPDILPQAQIAPLEPLVATSGPSTHLLASSAASISATNLAAMSQEVTIPESQSNPFTPFQPPHPSFFEPHQHRAQTKWDDIDVSSYHFEQGDLGQVPTVSNDQIHDLQIDDFDWNNFRASRMDWLGCETEWSDRQSQPSEGQSTTDFNRPNLDNPSPRDALVSPPATLHRSDISNHILQPLLDIPRLINSEGKETWPGILDRGGNEAWPFDYTSNEGFRKIKLPPLRQVLEQTVGDRPAIEKSTLMDLIKILSAPYIPSLNDSPALEALPAVAFLSQFVKIFFAEFHAVLPIIHVPTWQIVKCPTALLAAIACIGAAYSTAEGSEEVSALLAEITQRALFWMGQSDSTVYRNPAYITASCLHQIYSLGTGNRRLYEIADASRGLLVTSLRGLGILSPDSERDDTAAAELRNLRALKATALEAAWIRWKDKEMEKRIAWSVFEYDCTLCTLTSKRGAFSIAELPSKLPCSESLWEAHSAQAWASMVSFAATPATGLSFYPLLREILAGKADLASVPAWSKRICTQAIGRLLWDLREIEDSSTSNMLSLPSLSLAHERTKENLLHSLTNLHDSLSNPTCTSDIVNMNIGCLVTHYCHLNNGHEAMDLVVYIFRNAGRQSIPSIHNELRRAKEHLTYIFVRDPVATRRLVCHAASIIGIARECTIYTPCETMRVFMGFAYLLAFAKFFPFQQHYSGPSNNIEEPVVIQLDEIPWTRTPATARQVQHWIDHGGKATLDLVGNICDTQNFDVLKRAALKTLRDLKVWGLAGKFYKTMKNFD